MEYKTTPEKVREDLKREADTIREAVYYAVQVAKMELEVNESQALQQIKDQASAKRKKLDDKIKEFETKADLKIVSKYWEGVHPRYFLGDATTLKFKS